MSEVWNWTDISFIMIFILIPGPRVLNLTKLAQMMDIIWGFGLGCSTLSIHFRKQRISLSSLILLSDNKNIRVNLPTIYIDGFIYFELTLLCFPSYTHSHVLSIYSVFSYLLNQVIVGVYVLHCFTLFFLICVDEGSEQSYRGTEKHSLWRQWFQTCSRNLCTIGNRVL